MELRNTVSSYIEYGMYEKHRTRNTVMSVEGERLGGHRDVPLFHHSPEGRDGGGNGNDLYHVDTVVSSDRAQEGC